MYDIRWQIEYLRRAIPVHGADKSINEAVVGFIDSLARMSPEMTTVAYLVGDGSTTSGRGEESKVVLAFITHFDDVLISLFPPESAIHRELAILGCYLPISNYLYRKSEMKVLDRFNNDAQTHFDLVLNLKEIQLADKLHTSARERIEWLSELFLVSENIISSARYRSTAFPEDFATLRYVSEILSSISKLGNSGSKPKSVKESTLRPSNSDLCDLCFRHRTINSLFCSLHGPTLNQNDHRRLTRNLIKHPNRYERIRAKSKSIFESNFRNELIRTIKESTWEESRVVWWEVLETRLPNVYAQITTSSFNSINWESTISSIWADLHNDDEETIDPDISIGTLIDAECWFEMEAKYIRRDSKKPSAYDKAVMLLKKGGISQEKMAQQIGCAPSLISRVKKEMFK